MFRQKPAKKINKNLFYDQILTRFSPTNFLVLMKNVKINLISPFASSAEAAGIYENEASL